MTQVTAAGRTGPRHTMGEGPAVHHRPSYPLSGCVPAEPDSVSPGGIHNTLARDKATRGWVQGRGRPRVLSGSKGQEDLIWRMCGK
jgi:hypothetical protein